MRLLFNALPLILGLAAAPALAQTADPHAGHHPAAPPAQAPAKPEVDGDKAQGCPMMSDQMKGAPGPNGMTGGSGSMAMNGQGVMMQRCMTAHDKSAGATPAPGPDAHDHQHQ